MAGDPFDGCRKKNEIYVDGTLPIAWPEQLYTTVLLLPMLRLPLQLLALAWLT